LGVLVAGTAITPIATALRIHPAGTALGLAGGALVVNADEVETTVSITPAVLRNSAAAIGAGAAVAGRRALVAAAVGVVNAGVSVLYAAEAIDAFRAACLVGAAFRHTPGLITLAPVRHPALRAVLLLATGVERVGLNAACT
jgi:hypothetical protein